MMVTASRNCFIFQTGIIIEALYKQPQSFLKHNNPCRLLLSTKYSHFVCNKFIFIGIVQAPEADQPSTSSTLTRAETLKNAIEPCRRTNTLTPPMAPQHSRRHVTGITGT